MPIRVDGPDRAAPKAAVRRPRPKRSPRDDDKPSAKPKAPKKKSLLRRAVDAVGDVPLLATPLAPVAGITPLLMPKAKVRDLPKVMGEASGVSPALRVRAGKGSTMDKIAVGSMFAGPVARAGVRAAQTPVRFGILSDDAITSAMRAGWVNIHPEKMQTVRPVLQRARPDWTNPVERAQARGQLYLGVGKGRGNVRRVSTQGLPNRRVYPQPRLAWLREEAADIGHLGLPDDEHVNLFQATGLQPRAALFGSGQLAEEGFLYAPGMSGEAFQGTLDTGAQYNPNSPAIRRLLQILSRNLDINDEDLIFGYY